MPLTTVQIAPGRKPQHSIRPFINGRIAPRVNGLARAGENEMASRYSLSGLRQGFAGVYRHEGGVVQRRAQ